MFGTFFRWISSLLFRQKSSGIPATQSPSYPFQQSSYDSESFTKKLTAQLRRDEGVINTVYKDHLGYDTLGVGHLVDPRKGGFMPSYAASELKANGKVSDATIDRMLAEDIKSKDEELRRRAPWVNGLDSARYGCLLNMAFQMGVDGLLGFKNTLNMVKNGDYEGASKGMLNSLWARQTPARARRVAAQMKTGIWN